MGSICVAPLRQRRVGTPLALVLVLLAAMLGAAAPEVQAATVRANTTNITSNNERMVSYRHQSRSWQTADGALHMVVNRGTYMPGPGLALFSSFDGGRNWIFQQAFASTGDLSTGDGILQGDDLSYAYQTADNSLMFTRLHYDSALRSWSVTLLETAYASTTWGAINPAIDVDELGTVWCGFVARNRSNNDTNVRIVNRVGGGSAWTDPGLVFGPTDRKSIERSARPVRIPGGMGMVYTVRETTYWATRTNALPPNSAWATSPIFIGEPAKKITDPYASHFSVIADDQGNVHLVIIENFGVLYFKWPSSTQVWSAQKRVGDSRNVAYMQIGLNNGKLLVSMSVQRGKGLVLVSNDLGNTFSTLAETALVTAVPGINYNTARVEMPSRSAGSLALFQQYAIYEVQTLMMWSIPNP